MEDDISGKVSDDQFMKFLVSMRKNKKIYKSHLINCKKIEKREQERTPYVCKHG